MVQASNNFTITGRLTKKPEVKKTQNGKSYTYPTIAIQGIKKDDVQYVSFILWDKLADNIAKYCDKGDMISVLGSISFVRKSAEDQGYIQLTGDAVTFLSKAQKKEQVQPTTQPTYEPANEPFVPAQQTVTAPAQDIFAPFN